MGHFILNRHDEKRILVVGNEVGSLSKTIHEYNSNYEIGAIDILGNLETRKYAKWKFSVAKQKPNSKILVPKNRSLTDYLMELTYVMLEELEFDIIIPCSPLHSKMNFLMDLRRNYEVLFPYSNKIGVYSSDWTFIQTMKDMTHNLDSLFYDSDQNSLQSRKKNNYLFITETSTKYISSSYKDFIHRSSERGFLVPVSQLYCAAFVQQNDTQICLGIQEVVKPYNKDSILFPLDNNAFTTPSSLVLQNKSEIMAKLVSTALNFKSSGFFTIYFTLTSFNDPIPVSLIPNLDQNIIMWQMKTCSSILNLLTEQTQQSELANCCSFKIPIYSPMPVVTHNIDNKHVIHQNIPGIISCFDYPLCSIVGVGTTPEESERVLITERNKTLKEFNLV